MGSLKSTLRLPKNVIAILLEGECLINYDQFTNVRMSPSISLKEIIEMSHLSKSTFMRKFKEEFESTPHQWKINRCCQIVRHKASQPGIRVKDLMCEIGMMEQSHFNKFCRKHFQCTPKELIITLQEQESSK